MPKIGLADFEQLYTLNYSLLDFILTDDKFISQVNSTLGFLKTGSKETLAFIDGFIEVAENIDPFIKKISKDWAQFWQIISAQSTYSDDHKFKYLDLIISFADIEDIEKLAKGSNLKKTLKDRKTILSDVSEIGKFEQVISKLNIKFGDVNLSDAPEALVDFVYAQNMYDINDIMIRRVMQAKGIYDEDSFNKTNYETVQISKAQKLIDYVDQNIAEYVAIVYLPLEENSLESQEYLIKLLNIEILKLKDKKAIIEKTASTVGDLSDIKSIEVDAILLSELRVEPKWDNILNNFENNDNALTNESVFFLNHLPNAEILSTELITDSQSSIEIENLLINALIKNTGIKDKAFEYLVKAITEIQEEPEFTEIDEDHTEILLKNDLIKLSLENFASLKANFESKHIALAERNADDFVDDIETYQIDEDDVLKLLKSNNFDYAQKLTILNAIDQETVAGNINILTVAGRLALQYPLFRPVKKQY